MTSLLVGIRKIFTTCFLPGRLLLPFLCLATLTAAANPLTPGSGGSGSGIVFDASCPNGEEVCSNHPVDCLGGCALNATTGKTLFKWERTIFERIPDEALRVDIQAMKTCIDRAKVRTALLKAQENTHDTDSHELPCTVEGSDWHYIFPKYSISALSKGACDTTKAYLDELTGSCQDWKNSVRKAGAWVGYAFAGLAGVVASYFVVAQVGRCTGKFDWITLGDLAGACYMALSGCCSGHRRFR